MGIVKITKETAILRNTDHRCFNCKHFCCTPYDCSRNDHCRKTGYDIHGNPKEVVCRDWEYGFLDDDEYEKEIGYSYLEDDEPELIQSEEVMSDIEKYNHCLFCKWFCSVDGTCIIHKDEDMAIDCKDYEQTEPI